MPRRRSPTKSQAQRISESKAKLPKGAPKRDIRLRAAETKAFDTDPPREAAAKALREAEKTYETTKPGSAERAEAGRVLEVAKLEDQMATSERWAARAEMHRLGELPKAPEKLEALEAGQTLGQSSTLGTQPITEPKKRAIQRFWTKIRRHKAKQSGWKEEKRRFERDAKRAEKELKALRKQQAKDRKAAEKAAKAKPAKESAITTAERKLAKVTQPPSSASEAEFEKYRQKREKGQKELLKLHEKELKASEKRLESAEKKFQRERKKDPAKRAKAEKARREARADVSAREHDLEGAGITADFYAERFATQREAAERARFEKREIKLIKKGAPPVTSVTGGRALLELETPPSDAPESIHQAYRKKYTKASAKNLMALQKEAKTAKAGLKAAERELEKAKPEERVVRERELKAAQRTSSLASKSVISAEITARWYNKRFAEQRKAFAESSVRPKTKPPTASQQKKAAQKELQATSSAAGGELSKLRAPLRSAPAAEQAKYAKAHAAAYAKYIKALESDAKKAEKALKAAEKKLKTGTAAEMATAQVTMSTIRFTRDFLVKAAPQEQERAAKKGARLEKITEKARAKEKKAEAKPTTQKPKKRKAKKKTVKKPKPTKAKPKKAKAKKKRVAKPKSTKAKPKKAKAKKKRIAKPKSTRKPTPAARIQAAANLRGKKKTAFVKKEAKQRREADKAKYGTKYDLRPLYAYESSVEKELKLAK